MTFLVTTIDATRGPSVSSNDRFRTATATQPMIRRTIPQSTRSGRRLRTNGATMSPKVRRLATPASLVPRGGTASVGPGGSARPGPAGPPVPPAGAPPVTDTKPPSEGHRGSTIGPAVPCRVLLAHYQGSAKNRRVAEPLAPPCV